jgi:iron complex outermembrane receptor protein
MNLLNLLTLPKRPLSAAIALALSGMPILAWSDDASLSEVVVRASKMDAEPFKAANVGAAALPALRPATSDTASLLKDVPGVSLYGAGGVSSLPAIHGLADDRLRVKVDGMDLIASCPNHMNPALSYVDPSNVGILKVYTGIAPVSVGGDSIGGSIVAETAPPVFAKAGEGSLTQGEVGAFYRSNGNAYGGNVAGTYATESFSIRYTGATAQSDDYKAGGDFKNYAFTGRAGHTLGLNEVGSTAYQTRNHTLGLAFRGDNHLIELKVGLQDLPYQLYPNQRMDMLDNQQQSLNLRYIGQFAWGILEGRAYHETVDHFMDFGDDKRYWYGAASGGNTAQNGTPCSPISATCAAGMPMYTTGKTTGASVKANINLTQQDLLRVGAEIQQYRLNDWWPASGAGMWPQTFLNINDGQRDRSALFGEWEKRLNPQWMTLLGLRVEQVKSDAGMVHGYDQSTFPTNGATAGAMNQNTDAASFNNSSRAKTDHNWDMSALATYTPNAGLDVEFGIAQKMRSPNLYERYTWSTANMMMVMNNFVGDGNGYVGNLNLKPEQARTVSATFDWHAPNREWEFKATPYYTHVDDYIDAVRCSSAGMGSCPATLPNTLTTNFLRLQYANQTARLMGLDLSGKMPLAKTGVGEFGLKGLLNYTNGKNLDTGDGLYNIMPLNGKLTLTQRLGGWDNAIELVMVDSKRDTSAVRDEIKTPAYQLLNLRGSYSWKQTRLDFGVENLFDKSYFLPLGGAYTGQGTTMSNPALPNYPQWGTAVPGMGRSLYTGINVKF